MVCQMLQTYEQRNREPHLQVCGHVSLAEVECAKVRQPRRPAHRMLCLRVLSHRLFLVTEIHLPLRVLVVVHQQEGHLGGGVLGPRQGMAGISCALLGGETGIGVSGGDGSLGRLRGATCECRAMASSTHVRSAAVVACVNCHLRFSTAVL